MFSFRSTLDPLSFSPDIGSAGRLLRALVYAVHNENAVHSEALRDLVRERVHELRDDRLPPERMLKEMKTLVSLAIGERLPGRTTCELTGTSRRFMALVVRWSAEDYFQG